ncbi:MAG: YkgJ family cysteine cluster protein [Oscillospiraceae bacterium]|nr:YkgJ family cysteine cluster protein [Oscillospiraceae bacterium]MBR4655499.1 YkgJ family cysteine cluster protein [Oscillospiraceae bacterium]
MATLEAVIEELCRLEPFWNRCHPCSSKGKCCEGAKIRPSKKEQQVITEHLVSLPFFDKQQLMYNLMNSRICIYHTPEKCLIHDVRPEVCRYTPYQCVITNENMLNYSFVGSDANKRCFFKACSRQLSPTEAAAMRQSKYLLLDNFDRKTYYLSLNWLIQNHII